MKIALEPEETEDLARVRSGTRLLHIMGQRRVRKKKSKLDSFVTSLI